MRLAEERMLLGVGCSGREGSCVCVGGHAGIGERRCQGLWGGESVGDKGGIPLRQT